MKILIKNLFFTAICLNLSFASAGEKLLPDINFKKDSPYVKESLFKQIRIEQPLIGKNNTIENNNSKYDNMLSRMEQEWFNAEFGKYPEEKRINNLEERVFGTIQDGDTELRCKRLVQAFNARKSMRLRRRNLFSGVPTSVPVNADELLK